MNARYNRLIDVTNEEKNQMVAALTGTAYRGEVFSASIWEKGSLRRLYINFKDGYKARSTYLDLNNDADLTLDFMGATKVHAEVVAWIVALATGQQPARDGDLSFSDYVSATRDGIYGQDEIPF